MGRPLAIPFSFDERRWKMFGRLLRLSVVIGCALTVTVSARSVAHADANTAKAKQLYDDGVTNYNLGHFEDALTAFDQAYRIRHDAVFLFNIGQCQRALRRYEDAERSYRAYLRESPDLSQETREQIQKLIAEMQKAIDDERAKLPPPGTQPPKENQTATPSTTSPADTGVRTTGSSATTIVARPSHRSWVKDPVPWIALSVGVAAVAAGGVMLGLAAHEGDLASNASDSNSFAVHHSSDLTDQKAGWPLLAVGAVGIVVGGIVIAVDARKGR